LFIDYADLFWMIMAVLMAGVLLGRAWWYITSQEEKDLNRRIVRGSSSYLLGMNYLVSNQPELAIMELTRAAKQDPEAIEVQVVLGNLHREKGQAEKAIQIHKSVLDRKYISPSERNLAQFCLGLDYKSAGFIDRSIQQFEELLEVDRTDEQVYATLIKLYAEAGSLERGYRLQQELIRMQRVEDYSRLALMEVQIGLKHMDNGELDKAEKRYKRAIDLESRTVPAYLHYGDLKWQRGDIQGAVDLWEELVRKNYKRSHLVYKRLKDGYDVLKQAGKAIEIMEEVIANNPHGWRCRIFMARLMNEAGESDRSFKLLMEAARQNPHGLAIHQRMIELIAAGTFSQDQIQEYMEITEESIFFLDPFVCTECGYRTTEYLWKCPHCHSWESFIEMRM
jgi:lipopolysaccharide biosynthesis regulator YciM